MAKNYLDKSKFMAIKDLKIEELFVPEWDATVFVRALTAKELMDYINQTFDVNKMQPKDISQSQIVMVGYCMCDKDGKRILNDDEIYLLAEKNASAITRIFEVAQRLSGLGVTANSKN